MRYKVVLIKGYKGTNRAEEILLSTFDEQKTALQFLHELDGEKARKAYCRHKNDTLAATCLYFDSFYLNSERVADWFMLEKRIF